MQSFQIQYISGGKTPLEQLKNIRDVLDAGCRWVQLRFKNGTRDEILYLAEQVKVLCQSFGSKFIINDCPDIAKAVDADGVHLGLTDMAVSQARQILGKGKIIGGTANTLQDVLKQVGAGCDYIGLGPFRTSNTKERLSPLLGIQGISQIVSEISLNHNTQIVAIGGITLADVPAIIQTGVAGIAVSEDLTTARDKKEWINQFKIMTYV